MRRHAFCFHWPLIAVINTTRIANPIIDIIMADRTNTDPARMEKIVSLCKRRGFIFQAAEIYGGLNGCWDYGPMGVELKRNLKELNTTQ